MFLVKLLEKLILLKDGTSIFKRSDSFYFILGGLI